MQLISSYQEYFPVDVPKAVAQSFALGYAGGILFTRDPVTALVNGTVMATATLIHALITPLFRFCFPEKKQLDVGLELARTIVAITATAHGAAYLGYPNIVDSLGRGVLARIIMMYYGEKYAQGMSHASVVIL